MHRSSWEMSVCMFKWLCSIFSAKIRRASPKKITVNQPTNICSMLRIPICILRILNSICSSNWLSNISTRENLLINKCSCFSFLFLCYCDHIGLTYSLQTQQQPPPSSFIQPSSFASPPHNQIDLIKKLQQTFNYSYQGLEFVTETLHHSPTIDLTGEFNVFECQWKKRESN